MHDGSRSGALARTLLAEDELCTQGGYATGAERALMSAILFDGVQAYLNHALAPNSTQREKHREAVNWVQSKDDSYVFSFENVCEGLGIDADGLRLGIMNFVSCHDPKNYKRSRRNF